MNGLDFREIADRLLSQAENLIPQWLPNGKREGDEWVSLNPTRSDSRRGSFKVNLTAGKWCDFATCDKGGDLISLYAYLNSLKNGKAAQRLAEQLGLSGQGNGRKRYTYTPPNNTATLQHSCSLDQYAVAKKLPVTFLQELGLRDMKYKGTPAVRIPYLDHNGHEQTVRFRIGLDGKDRFRWKAGSKPFLYGLWRQDSSDYVILTEGESDCHTLWYHGFQALGLPGACGWREDRDAQSFNGISRIYVIVEPDRGGEAVKSWLAKSAIRDRAWLISLPEKDPSDLFLADPAAFHERFQTALNSAERWADFEARQSNVERHEAWERCESLAKLPNILERFAADLRRCGVVGEELAGKLIYLAVVSRFLPRPVSIAVKGPSGGGKSYVTEQVLRFSPERAYYALSAMSERALAYSEEPLEHRFLVIYEAAGLSSDFASYLVRSLLSEGRLAYETVEKTADGIKARLIVREGPTGLIVTTTQIRLHPENETRMISIPVTDTQDQTKAVMAALAENDDTPVDFEPWHSLQNWLIHAEHRVTIPYAKELTEKIPPIAVRLWRDFGAILALIKANAILHQATRDKAEDGSLIASIEDYRVVHGLVADLVAESIEATVPGTVRETVKAVKDGSDEGMSIGEIARKLKLDKSSTSRRVRAALDKGYLKNLEQKKGMPARLVVGDPLPEDRVILPAPEVLQCCSVDREGISPIFFREKDGENTEPASDKDSSQDGHWLPSNEANKNVPSSQDGQTSLGVGDVGEEGFF